MAGNHVKDCTVSGSLSFILHISRLLGIAPLKFINVRGGWRIQVSWIFSFYGKVVTVVLAFLAMISLMSNMSFTMELSFVSRFVTRRFMALADLCTSAVVTIAAAWTGMKRMRYLIDSIVELQQINKELKVYRQPSHLSENNKWVTVILSLLLGFFTFSLDYVSLILLKIYEGGETENTLKCEIYFSCLVVSRKSHQKHKCEMTTKFNIMIYALVVDFNDKRTEIKMGAKFNVLFTILQIFYVLTNLILLLVVLQLVLITMWVLLTLQLLNSGLQNMLQEIYKERASSSLTPLYPESILIKKEQQIPRISVIDVIYPKSMGINKNLQTAPAIIHRLAQLYCSLCDIIRQLNDSNSVVLLLLYMSFLLHLIIVPYRIVVDIFQKKHIDFLGLVTQVVWTCFHFTKLMLVTEPCHRIHDQMAVSKNLINQMLRYTSPDDFAILSELKGFHQHLVLNDISFSLREFFVVDRSLAVTIISSITTYLVIAVQYL